MNDDFITSVMKACNQLQALLSEVNTHAQRLNQQKLAVDQRTNQLNQKEADLSARETKLKEEKASLEEKTTDLQKKFEEFTILEARVEKQRHNLEIQTQEFIIKSNQKEAEFAEREKIIATNEVVTVQLTAREKQLGESQKLLDDERSFIEKEKKIDRERKTRLDAMEQKNMEESARLQRMISQ